MLRLLRTGSVALTALTMLLLPLQSASAHQTRVGSGMAVRNDHPTNVIVTIPSRHFPRPGTCRLWYPDRNAQQQPTVSDCSVTIPYGAMLLKG